MRYADYYATSAHPRRRAETRRIGADDLYLTRIRQGAHALDDPATAELIVGVVLGGVTRCRWTWGDGWNETAHRRAGDIGLSPPGSAGTFEVDGDHEVLVIGIPLPALIRRGMLDEVDARPFARLHDAYHRDTTNLAACLRLWALAATPSPLADMEADATVAGMLARWRAMAGAPVRSPRPVRPLDERTFALIEDRLRADPGARHRLADWAAAAGMTGAAFCRAFKARTGVPPHRYLLETRIGVAVEMLARPGSCIEDIAHALGFDSRAHFTRVFTRLRGRSPRQ